MTRHKIFDVPFADIYPHYVAKVERKGHTREEVGQVITWLTGYGGDDLLRVINESLTLDEFFAQAPSMNPNMELIKGVICGIRVEDVEDPLMQKIRYMDKLVDEVAHGKKMTSILRESK